MPDSNPILVEVTRTPAVESVHRGAAVVCDASGKVVASWGDVAQPVYARSAVKPIQALPLIESGAAERYGLTDEHIALACASHSGEEGHTSRVAAWLDMLGLGADDLECGGHFPYAETTTTAMQRRGEAPTRIHDNCSGKHTGFLCTARHMDEPIQGYVRREHSVQQRVEQVLAEVCGLDTAAFPCGIDGCGIPVLALPLVGMATGMARMADTGMFSPSRAEAAKRIVQAMTAHPFLVAGTGRFDTDVMARLAGRAAVKGGAEGVHCAILPTLGLGIAVKIDDGGGRASGIVTGMLLRRLGVMTDEDAIALTSHLNPSVTVRTGEVVGNVRAAETVRGGAIPR